MPDYTLGIQNGTMMIRDTGGVVEFWFKTGSSTYNNQQTWGFQANGGYSQQDFRLERGGNWQRFGAVQVDTDQVVMFRIIGEGLGWPTSDFSVAIGRATIPAPPAAPVVVDVGSNYVTIQWGGDGGNGGAAITSREIWYSNDGIPRYLVNQDGSRQVVGGLAAGNIYYFWARASNAKGMSGFGEVRAVKTYQVPDAPNQVFFNEITQNSVRAIFTGNGEGGTPVLEWQIAYGLNRDVPQFFKSGFSEVISGLSLAKTYYFWSRGRNKIGWGPWSARSEIALLAGAWVNYNGGWYRAVPWVRVAGVWKPAKPTAFVNGTWRNPAS